ncbi:Protein ZINC INDUCED FACILITATOR-LIKE 1, partial [Durusdinium trenchii]
VRSSRWWRLLMGRETSILIFGSMAFNFSVGVTEGPEVVFFKDYFGYTQSDMSNLLIVSCLAALVLTPILPVLNTYLGERQACVSGCIGVGLSTLFLVLGTGHKWVPAFCSGISVGLFGSMTGLGFMAMVHMCCPKDRLGTFLGIKSFFDSLSGTLSPAFGGWLYTRDHFLPYGLSCGLAAVTAGVFASFAPLQEKHKIIEQEEVEPMIGKELESDEVGIRIRRKDPQMGLGTASPALPPWQGAYIQLYSKHRVACDEDVHPMCPLREHETLLTPQRSQFDPASLTSLPSPSGEGDETYMMQTAWIAAMQEDEDEFLRAADALVQAGGAGESRYPAMLMLDSADPGRTDVVRHYLRSDNEIPVLCQSFLNGRANLQSVLVDGRYPPVGVAVLFELVFPEQDCLGRYYCYVLYQGRRFLHHHDIELWPGSFLRLYAWFRDDDACSTDCGPLSDSQELSEAESLFFLHHGMKIEMLPLCCFRCGVAGGLLLPTHL